MSKHPLNGWDFRGLPVTRRRFIGGMGGAAAVALVPVPAALRAAPAGAAGVPAERLTDWTIDDMWGVYTRYAEPIGFGRAQVEERAVAVAPMDEMFGA